MGFQQRVYKLFITIFQFDVCLSSLVINRDSNLYDFGTLVDQVKLCLSNVVSEFHLFTYLSKFCTSRKCDGNLKLQSNGLDVHLAGVCERVHNACSKEIALLSLKTAIIS